MTEAGCIRTGLLRAVSFLLFAGSAVTLHRQLTRQRGIITPRDGAGERRTEVHRKLSVEQRDSPRKGAVLNRSQLPPASMRASAVASIPPWIRATRSSNYLWCRPPL